MTTASAPDRTQPNPIDLRSDTVTRPSPAMRARDGRGAGRRRPVRRGPDRQRAAGARRRAARQGGGAFVPSGTMANQVALRVLTRPGDDVHRRPREPRGVARGRRLGAPMPGVQFTEIGDGGAVHRRGRARRGQAARATSSTRRRRWSRSRTRTTAAAAWSCRRRGGRSLPPRRGRRHRDLPRRRAAVERGGRDRASASPSWRRRSTWSPCRCRRGSARPAARARRPARR